MKRRGEKKTGDYGRNNFVDIIFDFHQTLSST
jgi:hypothetical protein